MNIKINKQTIFTMNVLRVSNSEKYYWTHHDCIFSPMLTLE